MRSKFLVIIILIVLNTGYAFDTDSLRNALSKLTIDEQLYQVNNIPYDIMVQTNHQLIPVFEDYINLAKTYNKATDLAQLYNNIDILYYYNGQYDKSVYFAQKSIHLLDSLGLKSELGSVYGELGYQMKRRDLSQAFDYMILGKDILEETNDSEHLSKIYDNLGVLYEMDNKPDSAFLYYRKALILKKIRKDSIGIPYTFNKFFTAFLLLNNPDSAKYYLDLSTKIRKSGQDIIGLAENYSMYGDYFTFNNNLDSSKQAYMLSLKFLSGKKYPYLTQYNYNKLSEVCEKLGDNSSALDYFKKSTQYSDSLLNERTNAEVARLEVQFDTEKKEKELAQKKADLVEKQLQLKHQNFILIITIIVLFFVILGAIENLRKFRYKRRKLQQEVKYKDEIAQIKLRNEIQEERLRISRDLHDNIGSQLTYIISSLDMASYGISNSNISFVSDKLDEIKRFSDATIDEFRDTIWALNQDRISLNDLKLKISSSISKAKSLLPEIKFKTHFEAKQKLDMDSEQGINVFRIVQESVNNAIKHSGSNEIIIKIFDNDHSIELTIEDKGKGFNIDQLERKNGLCHLNERAEKANADIEILSFPGQGTKICIKLKPSE